MSPSQKRPDARLVQILAIGAVLLAAGGYAAVPSAADRPDGSAWPAPEELDSLARYVSTLDAPAPAEGEVGVTLPAFGALLGEAPPPAPVRVLPRDRAVSAILIIGSTRVAVIDDATVRPGDRLPGGARVLSIEANRVVLGEPDGDRTVLQL